MGVLTSCTQQSLSQICHTCEERFIYLMTPTETLRLPRTKTQKAKK